MPLRILAAALILIAVTPCVRAASQTAPAPSAETRVTIDAAAVGARRVLLTASGRRAYNAPGRVRGVTVEEISPGGPIALVQVPPLSVSLLVLEADAARPNAGR
jgi:hypothetical protein